MVLRDLGYGMTYYLVILKVSKNLGLFGLYNKYKLVLLMPRYKTSKRVLYNKLFVISIL